MKILPLKGEVEAVMAVLQDDTYEDEEAMAKAIVKAVWPEIAKRDMFAVRHRLSPDSKGVLFGGFLYMDEAKRFAGRLGNVDVMAGVHSGAKQTVRMDELDVLAKAKR